MTMIVAHEKTRSMGPAQGSTRAAVLLQFISGDKYFVGIPGEKI